MKESVLRFPCDGEPLVGIIAEPQGPAADVGIVIVVGGPQYRVGSHRQFTLLARHLASHGFVALRFDYRGMGDSPGAARDFLDVEADISAAIDALMAARPALKRVVLWGLCDAASAALLYLRSTPDPRVAGLTLLNPWVRSSASLAQARIKHYYLRRLGEPEFWRKLLGGKIGTGALKGLLGNIASARKRPGKATQAATNGGNFQQRMTEALEGFGGPALVIISGDDITAAEFMQHCRQSPRLQWRLRQATATIVELAEADHTFSDPAQQSQVETATLEWLRNLSSATVAAPR